MPCISRRKSKLAIICALVLLPRLGISQTPEPTGRFPIGRMVVEWLDLTRGNRPLQMVIWYPAKRGSIAAPYYGDLKQLLKDPNAAEELKDLPGAKADTLTGVSHSFADANPAAGRFPLVLFSPGLGLSPYLYSTQLEDLASQGYVVGALSHPGDTASHVLKSGQMVRFDQPLWQSHPPEDANASIYQERAKAAAEDMIGAIDVLAAKQRGRFPIIDFTRIGAFGHSQGGRIAADACQMDSRIKACLNEDGRLDEDSKARPYWPVPGQKYEGSFAMLDWFDSGLSADDFASMHTTAAAYAQSRLAPGDTARQSYGAVEGNSYRITLLAPDMAHLAFTDLKVLTAKDIRARNQATENLRTITSIVAAFFNQELKGAAASTVSCQAPDRQLVVQCFSRAKQKPRH